MVRTPGSRSNIQCKARCRSLVRVKIADPFDLNQVVKRILPNLLGGNDSTFSQDITQPAFPEANAFDHLDHRVTIATPQIQALRLFIGEDSQFIKLHCPGDDASYFKIIYSI